MLRRIIIFLCFIGAAICEDAKVPRIAIVGAGPSGIAAASRLLQNGLDDVIILEAENRIGGRIHSVKFDEYMVDMGAQWIHGEKGNAAYELAAPLNLTDHSDEFEDTLYTSNGEMINPVITQNFTDNYVHYIENTRELVQGQGCNASIGECLETKIKQDFLLFPEVNETLQDELLWHFNLMQLSLDSADSWYDVSAKGYDFEIPDGDHAVNWRNRTYSTILDILMKRYPNPEEELPVMNKTVLNAEVTKIDYSNDDGTVKITTLDGKEYVVDHVIMTPSLGVLKADHETMFNPQLPEWKSRAIKTMGYGNECKIYLAFNEPWFNHKRKKLGGFSLLWSKEQRERLDSNPKTRWLPYILGLYYVEYKPRLLSIWVSGKGARLMDDLTDDEIFDQTVQVLNDYLSKDYNISRPVAMIRSKWHQNKHFRGTYSYPSLEAEQVNATTLHLSEPVTKMDKPIILFAGEATHENQSSTVNGAISAGWREADRLINLYKKKNSANEEAS